MSNIIGTYFRDSITRQLCRVVRHNAFRGDDHFICTPIEESKIVAEWTDARGVIHTKYDGLVGNFNAHAEWVRLSVERFGNPRLAQRTAQPAQPAAAQAGGQG